MSFRALVALGKFILFIFTKMYEIQNFAHWGGIPSLRSPQTSIPTHVPTRPCHSQHDVWIILYFFIWNTIFYTDWIILAAKAKYGDLDVVQDMNTANRIIVLTNGFEAVYRESDSFVKFLRILGFKTCLYVKTHFLLMRLQTFNVIF